MAGFNVAGLTDYARERNEELLSAMIAKSQTIGSGKVKLIEGIKHIERLHFFAPSLVWQTGNCVGGDSTSGGTTFTEKDLQVAKLTHYNKSCIDDFNSKWYGSMLPAGSYYDDEDYIQAVADKMVLYTQRDVENAIWKGGYASNTGGMMDSVDGWLKQLVNTTYSASTFAPAGSYTSFTQSNAHNVVSDLIQNAPDAIGDIDLTMFISRKNFNVLKDALANQYSTLIETSKIDGVDSFVHPVYTHVTVMAVNGLSGEDAIVLTYGDNLVAGTDLLSDDEVKIGYVDDEDKIFERIKFKLGTEVAFESLVGVHTW